MQTHIPHGNSAVHIDRQPAGKEQDLRSSMRPAATRENNVGLRSFRSSTSSSYGSLNLTAEDAEKLERYALKARDVSNGGRPNRKRLWEKSADSSDYGSLGLTAEEADRLEQDALKAAGRAGPNQGRKRASGDTDYGSLDITWSDAEQLERDAIPALAGVRQVKRARYDERPRNGRCA